MYKFYRTKTKKFDNRTSTLGKEFCVDPSPDLTPFLRQVCPSTWHQSLPRTCECRGRDVRREGRPGERVKASRWRD